MTNLEIRLALPEDDADLRKILRENPLEGDISLSFEREPSYFAAARVEAPDHQIVVAKDLDINRIVGMGARSLRPLFVNGEVGHLGYLSQFRIDKNYRAMRKGLTKAAQLLKDLDRDGKSPYYYTSIIEDNLPARRLLTRGLPGLPKYSEYALMHTLAIYSRRKKRAVEPLDGSAIRRGNEVKKSAIIDCLQRNLKRYQFAPFWDDSLLFHPTHTPGLTPDDFFVVSQGERVTGCAALWDQGAFKQTVVRGYSNRVRYFRPLINIAARIYGRPHLPAINTQIKHAYLSHLAVDNDDQDIFRALVRAVYNHAVEHGYSYFMTGLSEQNPFLERTRREYAHIDYRSILYLVTWNLDHEPGTSVDDRVPGPEIAIL
jgi:hypothetical protein